MNAESMARLIAAAIPYALTCPVTEIVKAGHLSAPGQGYFMPNTERKARLAYAMEIALEAAQLVSMEVTS